MIRNFFRILSRAIPTGTRLPIVAGPLSGAWWFAGAAAGRGKGLAPVLNLCEPEQLRLAAELSKGADTCFDIGANVGLYSLLFARNARHVFSFEPLPRNIAWLQCTIEANRLSNVTVIPAAVSDCGGLFMFRQGANCALGSLSNESGIPVTCTTVDDVVQKFGRTPNLVKIDVEGAELRVFHGAHRTLLQSKPTILLSTHGETVKQQCLEYLSEVGYTRFNEVYESEFCISA